MPVPENAHTYVGRLATFTAPVRKGGAGAGSRKKAAATANPIWPHARPTADQLARAGLYYAPTPAQLDNVRCFLCLNNIDGWEPTDDPATEHYSLAPNCGWAVSCHIGLYGPQEDDDPLSERAIELRTATFDGRWPHDDKRGWRCKTKKMVEAGWSYDPSPEYDDCAKCFYCDLTLDGWERKDDPWIEHEKRAPQCPFFTLSRDLDGQRQAQQKRRRGRSKNSPASTIADDSSVASFGDSVSESEAAVHIPQAVAPVAKKAGRATGKGRKAASVDDDPPVDSQPGPKKTRSKRAKKGEDASDGPAKPKPSRAAAKAKLVVVEPEPEPEPEQPIEAIDHADDVDDYDRDGLHREHDGAEDQDGDHDDVGSDFLTPVDAAPPSRLMQGVKRSSDTGSSASQSKRTRSSNAAPSPAVEAIPVDQDETAYLSATETSGNALDRRGSTDNKADDPIEEFEGGRDADDHDSDDAAVNGDDDATPRPAYAAMAVTPASQQIPSSAQSLVPSSGPAYVSTPSPSPAVAASRRSRTSLPSARSRLDEQSVISVLSDSPTPAALSGDHGAGPYSPLPLPESTSGSEDEAGEDEDGAKGRVEKEEEEADEDEAVDKSEEEIEDDEDVDEEEGMSVDEDDAVMEDEDGKMAEDEEAEEEKNEEEEEEEDHRIGTPVELEPKPRLWEPTDMDDLQLHRPASDENVPPGLRGQFEVPAGPVPEEQIDDVVADLAGGGDRDLIGAMLAVRHQLTAEERKMTVEEWVMHNAAMGEQRLEWECDRLVGLFEQEGRRALAAIEAVTTIER